MNFMNDIIERALKHTDRRLFLGKQAIVCPDCGTNQVQLTNHFVTPAEWKCRHCKKRFNFEPIKMCNEPSGYFKIEINGNCPDCNQPTIDGDAFEQCAYSTIKCETCGWAPCDGSCYGSLSV